MTITQRPLRRPRLLLVVALCLVLTGVAGCSDGEPGKDAGRSPGSDAAALINQGLSAQQSGDLDAAEEAFKAALAADPSSYPALYDLGQLAQSQCRGSLAKRYYRQALEIEDTFVPALYNLAILFEDSAPKKAAGIYQQIIGIDPDQASTYIRLSRVLTELGRTDEAEAVHERGLQLDPAMADPIDDDPCAAD